MSAYDFLVMQSNPCLYLPLDPYSPTMDLTNLNTGSVVGKGLGVAVMPNGDLALRLDGQSSHLSVEDADHLSISHTGSLTIEAWLRPDVLQFPKSEGSGFVHWAGKGTSKKTEEYSCRFYNRLNSENKPNCISGHVFRPDGGLSVGASFQEPVTPGGWIHVVVCFTTIKAVGVFMGAPRFFSKGYVSIYKNGILKSINGLILNLTPQAGDQDLFLGTKDMQSFFQGGIGKFAVYNRILTDTEIVLRYQHMAACGNHVGYFR